VESDRVLTVKSMADYHYCESDRLSSSNEYLRLLNLKLDSTQRYRVYLNASSHLMHVNRCSEAQNLLSNAELLNKDFRLYFLKFKICLFEIDESDSEISIQPAMDNLIKMDNLINTSNEDPDSVSLLAKWMAKNRQAIHKFTDNNKTISGISNKYSKMIF
jgi:hypothetical protein